MVTSGSGCSQGLSVGSGLTLPRVCVDIHGSAVVECHADCSGLGCLSGPHPGPRAVLPLGLYWSGWSLPSPGAMVTARPRLLLRTVSMSMVPTATEVYVDVHVPMVSPRAIWNLGSGLHPVALLPCRGHAAFRALLIWVPRANTWRKDVQIGKLQKGKQVLFIFSIRASRSTYYIESQTQLWLEGEQGSHSMFGKILFKEPCLFVAFCRHLPESYSALN